MNFKNPEYFWFLLPILLVLVIKIRQRPPVIRFSLSSHLMRYIPPKNFMKYMTLLIKLSALFLLVVALARPRIGLVHQGVSKPSIDIMLVMDVSDSMRAIDFKPLNRMEAAVSAAKEFVASRNTDRIGIVAFSALPVLQCPLTLDNDAVARLLDSVNTGMIDMEGTAVGLGIALALKYLGKSDTPSKVIILLTDGANNSGAITPIDAAVAAKEKGVRIYTIGTGKPGQAMVPVEDPIFGKRLLYIEDELDEETLKDIAKTTGGLYFRATSLEKLNEIYSQIDDMEKTVMDETLFFDYQENFHKFLYAGFFLILLELIMKFFLKGLYN